MLSLPEATVLAVTETWLDASLEMAITVPGYNFEALPNDDGQLRHSVFTCSDSIIYRLSVS